jgi:hypothetical protein
VLMAAPPAAMRAVGRPLGRTTGAASKWRVRYAKDRYLILNGSRARYRRSRRLETPAFSFELTPN